MLQSLEKDKASDEYNSCRSLEGACLHVDQVLVMVFNNRLDLHIGTLLDKASILSVITITNNDVQL